MKKILGISLIAVLAVSPMMASAADGDRSVTPLNATMPESVSDELASTTYVQGAFATAAGKIDALITDTTGPNGTYAQTGKTVSANLKALDDQIKLNVTAIGDANSGLTQAVAANTAAIGNATSGLTQAVAANTAAIGDANSGLTQAVASNTATLNELTGNGANSIASQISSAISAVNSTNEGLASDIEGLTSSVSGLSSDVADINAKKIKYVDTWPNGTTKTMSINSLSSN